MPSPLLYDGRALLFKSNTGILTRLDAATGQDALRPGASRGSTGVYASPVGAAGRVYVVGRNGATVVLGAGRELKVLANNRSTTASTPRRSSWATRCTCAGVPPPVPHLAVGRMPQLAVAIATVLLAGPARGETLPGADAFDPALTAKLQAAWTGAAPGYAPRTRHLQPTARRATPTGCSSSRARTCSSTRTTRSTGIPGATRRSRRPAGSGRPVLLSVGYSTCHWCHVMEEESFEDEEIARVLNESYVAIKVDREERPDVDAVYMNAVQALTGSGGWPMTVWLTPDRKPFFGGTYFPPRDGDRGVGDGIPDPAAPARDRLHADAGRRVAEAAASVVAAIRERAGARAPARRAARCRGARARPRAQPARFDAGTAEASRARRSSRAACRSASCCATTAARATPRRWRWRRSRSSRWRRAGSTIRSAAASIATAMDARWLVPHFEKMLYDNALLAVAYLEGYQASGRRGLRRRRARDPRATSSAT